ncbi:MAG: fumarylacetoacetase [Hyphomicrobiales bacterium]
MFSTAADLAPRVGVAIGEDILDLAGPAAAGLLPGLPTAFSRPPRSMPSSPSAARSGRRPRPGIAELLDAGCLLLRDDAALRARVLVRQADARMHRPVEVMGFTDFYSSREHATNVGMMFRDKNNPLLPNWLHIPIAYNGRASTVIASGTPVRRPIGQLKGPADELPRLAPSARLDIELEMAVIVGRDTALGDVLTIEEANAAIFGYALLNDWSARDIQQWEYVPLGPFQSKAFATSIGDWVVTAEALMPFRVEGPAQDPAPLPHLRQSGPMNHDIQLAVTLAPDGTEPLTICRTSFRYMYWSSAQQLVHHASSGCVMRVGDVLGSGTISGPTRDERGSLLEITWGGSEPIEYPNGLERRFLEDGDTVVITGWCEAEGHRIGFGSLTGTILPARMPDAWKA